MASYPTDEPEDLLADATALVLRARLSVAGFELPIVVGFRREGAASFYFGDEPAYHFTSDGQLRRAIVDGILYKAEHGNLIALTRQKSEQATELVRRALSSEETTQFMHALNNRLVRLQQAIADSSVTWLGQVPSDADMPSTIRTWLDAHLGSIVIATRPNVA